MIFRHLLNMRSHPTWVRGLKPAHNLSISSIEQSHPTWVRGLKHVMAGCGCSCLRSHPTWVRGLKPVPCRRCPVEPRRTLRGCVD